jgi:hypothetical protein
VLSSCGWHGISNVAIPGGPGSGSGAMTVYVQVPDTLAINGNSKVMVADVFVGSIKAIQLKNWIATLTLGIDKNVKLPKNAIAKIGQTGLSTYLAGQASLEEVVSETPVPNLYAVFCGPRPSNPAELLSSPQFSKMLHEARERFQYVVLDSPPVMFVADARVLAPQAEACVLVAQGGKTPRKAARSRRGRAEVDALLKDIENGTVGMAGGDAVDFASLRRELGLDTPHRAAPSPESYDAEHAPDPVISISSAARKER